MLFCDGDETGGGGDDGDYGLQIILKKKLRILNYGRSLEDVIAVSSAVFLVFSISCRY